MQVSPTIKTIGLTALMLTAVSIGTTVPVFASSDDERYKERQENRRENLHNMHGEFRQNLSEEQIEMLKEAREYHEEGDFDSARDLLESAGIDMPMKQMRDDMKEKHDSVRDAIESGNYEAFQAATADAPVDIEISEEQFKDLQEVHKLHEAGDFEAARDLAQELGLPFLKKGPAKKFMNTLTTDQKELMKKAHILMKDGDMDAARDLLEEADIQLPSMPKKEGFFKRWFGKKDK